MNEHQIIIDGKTKYKCDCGKIFDKKSSLNSHSGKCKSYIKEDKKSKSKYKSIKGEYICECGRCFTNPQSFNAHLSHCDKHHEVIGTIRKKRPNELYHTMCWENKTNDELNKIYEKTSKTLKSKYKSGEIIPTFLGKHHSEETKEKIRKAIHNRYIDGKQHGAFIKDKPSYIEQWFIDNVINKLELYNKFDIVREFAFYPYYLDFAFVNIQLDVELDGEFHYIRESNIKHDKKRNEYILSKDWKVYRIRYNDIIKNPENVINEFLAYLNTFNGFEKKLDNKLYSYQEYKTS